MPLYSMPVSDVPEYLDYFNRHADEGKLTPTALKGILEQKGLEPTDEEVQQVINGVCLDRTGIDFQAFIDYVSSYHALKNPDDEYKAAFRLYDVKQTGSLTKADVVNMFMQMHIGVNVNKLFEEADTNNDGSIDFDEFVQLMKKAY